MAAAGGYSFPILSNGDIIACINELGIGYTEAQLIKPNPTEVPSLILTPLLTVSPDCSVRDNANMRDLMDPVRR